MKNIGKNYDNCIGIYKITCTGNNKFYIGSSINIRTRWQEHLSHLRGNIHRSKYLQRSYNKYGEGSLVFEVLLVMFEYNEPLLRMIEQYYIEEQNPAFNSASPVVYDRTIIWKQKISKSTKKLYENGYVNPRKGIGQKYSLYDRYKNLIATNIDIMEVCKISGYNIKSYRTLNTLLRKYNGIHIMKNQNLVICKVKYSFKDVLQKYPTFFTS